MKKRQVTFFVGSEKLKTTNGSGTFESMVKANENESFR